MTLFLLSLEPDLVLLFPLSCMIMLGRPNRLKLG